MIVKRFTFALFIVLLFSGSRGEAQDVKFITGSQISASAQTTQPDTFPLLEINEVELESISNLRSQLEKQNGSYATPVAPSENLLRFINKEEVQLSPEALYWVNWMRDPATIFDETVTFEDTVIVNPLFTPIVFRGGLFPSDLQLYDKDFIEKQYPKFQLYQPDTTLFQKETIERKLRQMVYDSIRLKHPQYFRYSELTMPKEAVKTHVIKKNTYEPELIKIESEPTAFTDMDAPVKFIPERRYWTSHFESAIQFAQNYISENWHKGGASTMNLNNRELFTYNYNKNKIKFTNLLEIKNSLYTAPKDTMRNYKVGDDVFRIYSNYGYKAFDKWYYTLEMEFKTQLFSSFEENSNKKLSGLLSPFSINIGLGMQYDLNKTFPSRHKKLALSANIAPLSYTYVMTIDKDIDLGRHFQKDKNAEFYPTKQSLFGSTINATMSFQFTRNISWYSRLNYTTNYQRIQGEFENRLNMSISRFFSTTVSLNLRFDDGVEKKKESDNYLQVNELLSFGFNYKW